VAKKSVAKYKGHSKEGQFVEVQSNVGQKIKCPNWKMVSLLRMDKMDLAHAKKK
jgi:hypothetical protein